MIDIGRLCVKTAGRDAGRTCVVVDLVDDHTVLIDGDVRRRACNPSHLEPLAEKVEIRKGASHDDVKHAFEKLSLPVWKTTPKKAATRPAKKRKATASAAATATTMPKAANKESAKEATGKAGSAAKRAEQKA